MDRTARWIQDAALLRGKRLLCLVDGEHYPAVTLGALEELRKAGALPVGLLFAGGNEKIARPPVELFGGWGSIHVIDDLRNPAAVIRTAVMECGAQAAVDLSDDPVLCFEDRVRFASCFLAAGIPCVGADFAFFPPETGLRARARTLLVWGTNKRVGKTAFSIFIAKLCAGAGLKPVILSMGRGGPGKPELILPAKTGITADYLLHMASAGFHAASDCWEDAFFAGVPVVGCRRCGGGVAGTPFFSNVREGLELADGLDGDCIILEGSGPTLPPAGHDASVLIVSARIPPSRSIGFFGEYRVNTADLLIISQCDEVPGGGPETQELYRRVKELRPELPVLLTAFRMEPEGDIRGRSVFVAAAGGDTERLRKEAQMLEERFGCTVAAFSAGLADRAALLREMESTAGSWDLLLTELKAAAVDTGAAFARRHGKEVLFLNNRPRHIGGDAGSLEEALLPLLRKEVSDDTG